MGKKRNKFERIYSDNEDSSTSENSGDEEISEILQNEEGNCEENPNVDVNHNNSNSISTTEPMQNQSDKFLVTRSKKNI